MAKTSASSSSSRRSKYCPKCKRTLSVSKFWKATKSLDGLFAHCKDCGNKEREVRQKRVENGEVIRRRGRMGKDVSLKPLLEIRSSYRSGWTLEQARDLVAYVTSQASIGNAVKLSAIYADFCKKYNPNYGENKKTVGGCQSLIKELKMAAKDGMTLNEYWQKGRTHKYIFHAKKD